MNKILLILIIGILISNCDESERIELKNKLPEAPKMLGIYCIFEPDSVWKAQIFQLGSISDYEFDNYNLLVNNADVSLFCNEKFQEKLIFTKNGIFVSKNNNKPLTGRNYYIRVSKKGFPSIKTAIASLPPKIIIDRIFINNTIQLGLFNPEMIFEKTSQLNLYFNNELNLPVYLENIGSLAIPKKLKYENYKSVYKNNTDEKYNEMIFLRCNNKEACNPPDDYNIISLSFVSNDYYNFMKGEEIQDDASSSFITYYPGNVNSNIENGLGLFAGKNTVYFDVDTIDVR